MTVPRDDGDAWDPRTRRWSWREVFDGGDGSADAVANATAFAAFVRAAPPLHFAVSMLPPTEPVLGPDESRAAAEQLQFVSLWLCD